MSSQTTTPSHPKADHPTPSSVEVPPREDTMGGAPTHDVAAATAPAPPNGSGRHRVGRIIIAVVAIVVIGAGAVWVIASLGTISTDDAYVNGHVTMVAPRVPGQVMYVFVDDNNRVHKNDRLVQLDKKPYQVQVDIAQAGVDAANADLVSAQASVRGMEGQTRSLRFLLEHSIEDVDNQIAQLRSKVATWDAKKAALTKAQADYERAVPLVKSGSLSTEELDRRKEVLLTAQADVEAALQGVYEIRVGLGLPPKPEKGDDLTEVPPDLDQTFSSVRQAQASLIQTASQLGVVESFNKSPKQMVADFYKRDPEGNIDRIYAQILKDAPAVKQAQTKLASAQRVLDQALLNLSYCDVVAEIDGVVTRRNVNPGNNVIAGQGVMAIRSLTEIWVDANFKETQLASLRIGQPVDLDVDMYGKSRMFKGRISGFTMGTGSTLALLPAENATGNFVKVVQRLPVRIDLVGYNPEVAPLFIGLSVTPYVHVHQPATGDDAGKVLQPYLPTSRPATEPATRPETQP